MKKSSEKLSKIGWMINCRPVQHPGDDADAQNITPNHFLGTGNATFPPDLPENQLSL